MNFAGTLSWSCVAESLGITPPLAGRPAHQFDIPRNLLA